MTNKPLKILAINPGTRYLGIAVFIGTELRDWAIKVMKGKSTADCVTDYVNQYGIDVIAIKKFHVSRSSKTLRMIADELENLAANRKIVFYEYSIDDLKEKLLFEPRGNKHLLMEEISKRYPFLLSDLQRESVHKNHYLVRMFEAVALGTVCFNAIDIGKKVGKLKT